jgi:hypothetical protein
VVKAKPGADYTVHVWFTNGEQGVLDMKPLLDFGIFSELRDPSLFNSVRTDGLSIEWPNDASLCPDTVYEDSVKI